MEIFILIFGAVFLFFYFLKKESEKSDKRYLDQIRFFNDSHIQNQSQKILNDLYRDVQFTLDNVEKQVKTLQSRSDNIQKELINVNHLINMLLGQTGMEQPKTYKWGKKKDNHLKVVKNKKEMESKDGKNNYDENSE